MDAPLRIENRAQLIYLLTEAAELEHGIMCCYLFAAFSLKQSATEGVTEEQLGLITRWRRTILQVGLEEMLHMGLVCNLLTAVGGAPHLRRPNLPSSPRAYPPSFRLALVPFCRESLNSFAFIERPLDLAEAHAGETSFQSPDLPETKLSDIFSSARDYSSQGTLYTGIEDGLQYLAQKYGEDRLFVGPPEAQVDESRFGLAGLIPVTDLASAAAALQGIVTQGEGAQHGTKDSHYGKFVGIQEEYERALEEDPKFEPGRPVVWNPYSMMPNDVTDPAAVNLLEDPLSVDMSNLFDGCYELLIQMLGRLYLHDEEQESELAQISDVTVSMMAEVIGPLGQALTTLPAGPSQPGLTAGPSFRFSRDVSTPPHKAAVWAFFTERLQELSAYCGFLRTDEVTSPVITGVQRALTQYAAQLSKAVAPGVQKQTASAPPAISVRRNGPYSVTGSVPLVRKRPVLSEHGEPITWEKVDTLAPNRRYLLCRCGQSSNKPFCDGTHAKVGFDGAEAADTGPIAERRRNFEVTKLVVRDDRSICVHAGFCGNRVTDIWKMRKNTEDTQVRAQLMAMIERCPSGALAYALEPDSAEIEPDYPMEISVTPDGPLWITGGIPIERSDGEPIESRNRMTLCRCGASKTKPLCDGSHKEIGFSAD